MQDHHRGAALIAYFVAGHGRDFLQGFGIFTRRKALAREELAVFAPFYNKREFLHSGHVR